MSSKKIKELERKLAEEKAKSENEERDAHIKAVQAYCGRAFAFAHKATTRNHQRIVCGYVLFDKKIRKQTFDNLATKTEQGHWKCEMAAKRICYATGISSAGIHDPSGIFVIDDRYGFDTNFGGPGWKHRLDETLKGEIPVKEFNRLWKLVRTAGDIAAEEFCKKYKQTTLSDNAAYVHATPSTYENTVLDFPHIVLESYELNLVGSGSPFIIGGNKYLVTPESTRLALKNMEKHEASDAGALSGGFQLLDGEYKYLARRKTAIEHLRKKLEDPFLNEP